MHRDKAYLVSTSALSLSGSPQYDLNEKENLIIQPFSSSLSEK